MYADVLELIRRLGGDPVLTFWKAYSKLSQQPVSVRYVSLVHVGQVMEGRETEGMREVETVQDSREMVLCARLLLIYAHKMCRIVGRLT